MVVIIVISISSHTQVMHILIAVYVVVVACIGPILNINESTIFNNSILCITRLLVVSIAASSFHRTEASLRANLNRARRILVSLRHQPASFFFLDIINSYAHRTKGTIRTWSVGA